MNKYKKSGFTRTLSSFLPPFFLKKDFGVSKSSYENTKKSLVSGFTIIELLIVIAIIAILSAIAISSLTSSRTKAGIAAAQTTIGSVLPIAITCIDAGKSLGIITSSNNGGGVICDDTESEWPPLTGGWAYDSLTPTSDPLSSTFTFSASDSLENNITCTDTAGCVTTLAL